MAIPPAWTDVWISPRADGHLQATGRDARGRKQYRYHRRWRTTRDASKFAHLIAFGEALPRIRRRVEADLSRRGLDLDRVVALVVRLLELTLIRVGNDEYATSNRSYGLTTLRDRHVRIDGSSIRFHFRGKSGRVHDVDLRDPRLARLVRRCHELPGQDLFQYVDDAGETRTVGSADVNDYLRRVGGADFTAKDFRTWAGTTLAYRALCAAERASSGASARREVVAAMGEVADRLGNTPAVCRASYVHPAVVDAYLDSELGRALVIEAEERGGFQEPSTRAEELRVLALLRARSRRPRRR